MGFTAVPGKGAQFRQLVIIAPEMGEGHAALPRRPLHADKEQILHLPAAPVRGGAAQFAQDAAQHGDGQPLVFKLQVKDAPGLAVYQTT
jgi:hypothetical protein